MTQSTSPKPRSSNTVTNRDQLFYEAIREKGAMVLAPSSAIETMGLDSTLATTAMAKQQE